MFDYISYLEPISKRKVPLKIVDTILLNPNTMDAYKWIFTNQEGYLKVNNLVPLPFKNVNRFLLENIFHDILKQSKYKKNV